MITRTKLTLIAMGIAALSLSGCETNPSRQEVGTVLGAIVGGVVGNQFGGGSGNTLFTIAGALAGAWAGSSIGRSMDDQDRRHAAENLEENLERRDGGNIRRDWGHDGRYYRSHSYTGRTQGLPLNCKEYVTVTTIWIDGHPKVASSSGVACKNLRTGQWEIRPRKVDTRKWDHHRH